MKIGIALSHRITAQKTFLDCKKIVTDKASKLAIAKDLEFDTLAKNKAFLNSDLIIVFGGDGSFLKTSQAIQNTTPLIGIGCGERNFLSHAPASNAAAYLQETLSRPLKTETRTRIAENRTSIPVLNEILISPHTSATIMHYELFINGKFQFHDYADGVLICTPTGSSAYNHAAGGPLITLPTSAFAITPLHSIEQRTPLVVPDSSRIEIRKIQSQDKQIELVLDGQQRHSIPNAQNESIQIHKSPHPLCVAEYRPQQMIFPPVSSIEKLAPSSRFVLTVIRQLGTATQAELNEATKLDPRTIRRAIAELLENAQITQRPFASDQRKYLYHAVASSKKPVNR